MLLMGKDSDDTTGSGSVSESDATSGDGTRYRTLVVNKSGESDSDDS